LVSSTSLLLAFLALPFTFVNSAGSKNGEVSGDESRGIEKSGVEGRAIADTGVGLRWVAAPGRRVTDLGVSVGWTLIGSGTVFFLARLEDLGVSVTDVAVSSIRSTEGCFSAIASKASPADGNTSSGAERTSTGRGSASGRGDLPLRVVLDVAAVGSTTASFLGRPLFFG
jgi:hypothetical protein